MLAFLAQRARQMIGDHRGDAFVEYSLFVLLIAMTALALLSHVARN